MIGDGLRLLIDDSAAFNQLAGIGRYARHIVPALLAARPDWETRIAYAPDHRALEAARQETLALLPAGVDIRRLPFSRRRADQLWFRARVPLTLEAFTGRGDVVYSPDFTSPPAGRRPRFITIHDLAFLLYPDLAPPRLRQYLAAIVPRQAQAATKVLTVSAASRQDAIAHLALNPADVVVVPNGVAERFFHAPPLTHDQRHRLGIARPFILCVGSIEPRKNHRTLFSAMRVVKQSTLHQLAIVGRLGWKGDEIVAGARQLAEDGSVVFLDNVDNTILPSVYASASATVYPSWYEGFGLPVLESLAAGVPTVISNAAALKELGGDVVSMAPADDPDALAEAILKALEPGQASTAQCQNRRLRARRYDWDHAGQLLAEALEQGMAGR